MTGDLLTMVVGLLEPLSSCEAVQSKLLSCINNTPHNEYCGTKTIQMVPSNGTGHNRPTCGLWKKYIDSAMQKISLCHDVMTFNNLNNLYFLYFLCEIFKTLTANHFSGRSF